jgi:acetyl esterase/lipase
MGGSAGGNLAGAVALHYSTHATLKPHGLIIAVPAITIDPRALPAEYASQFHPERYTDTPLLTRASMTKAAGTYRTDVSSHSPSQPRKTSLYPLITFPTPCSAHQQPNTPPELYAAPSPTDPRYSILLHPSLSHLPQTALLACTNDPTYDETLIFHGALTKAGVSASLEVFHGYPHFFWIIPGLEGTGRFLDMWGVKLRGMIGG